MKFLEIAFVKLNSLEKQKLSKWIQIKKFKNLNDDIIYERD